MAVPVFSYSPVSLDLPTRKVSFVLSPEMEDREPSPFQDISTPPVVEQHEEQEQQQDVEAGLGADLAPPHELLSDSTSQPEADDTQSREQASKEAGTSEVIGDISVAMDAFDTPVPQHDTSPTIASVAATETPVLLEEVPSPTSAVQDHSTLSMQPEAEPSSSPVHELPSPQAGPLSFTATLPASNPKPTALRRGSRRRPSYIEPNLFSSMALAQPTYNPHTRHPSLPYLHSHGQGQESMTSRLPATTPTSPTIPSGGLGQANYTPTRSMSVAFTGPFSPSMSSPFSFNSISRQPSPLPSTSIPPTIAEQEHDHDHDHDQDHSQSSVQSQSFKPDQVHSQFQLQSGFGFQSQYQSPITPSAQYDPYNQPQDLSHPPGYKQDHATSFSDRPDTGEDLFQNSNPFTSAFSSSLSSSPGFRNNNNTPRGSILDANPYTSSGYMYSPPGSGGGWTDTFGSYGASRFGSFGGEVEGPPLWDTALAWARSAGKRLSLTEAGVWRAVRGSVGGSVN